MCTVRLSDGACRTENLQSFIRTNRRLIALLIRQRRLTQWQRQWICRMKQQVQINNYNERKCISRSRPLKTLVFRSMPTATTTKINNNMQSTFMNVNANALWLRICMVLLGMGAVSRRSNSWNCWTVAPSFHLHRLNNLNVNHCSDNVVWWRRAHTNRAIDLFCSFLGASFRSVASKLFFGGFSSGRIFGRKREKTVTATNDKIIIHCFDSHVFFFSSTSVRVESIENVEIVDDNVNRKTVHIFMSWHAMRAAHVICNDTVRWSPQIHVEHRCELQLMAIRLRANYFIRLVWERVSCKYVLQSHQPNAISIFYTWSRALVFFSEILGPH